MSGWFEAALKREYHTRWVNFKPQQPRVMLKWSPPRTMSKIPLREMSQDFTPHFKWWYYDWRTGEAVIVLNKEGKMDTIRVFDRMWLKNLCADDVYTLYKWPLFYDSQDIVQALQFQNVIGLCFTFEIHAGVTKEEKYKKYEEVMNMVRH